MKTLIQQALKIIIGLLLFVQIATASHIAGSDITYECVQGSPGTYKIRLVLYRDCSGGMTALCDNCTSCQIPISVMGADPVCNGTQFGTASLSLVSVRDVNPNPECPNTKNTCTNAGCVTPGTFSVPAIERYEFEGLVDLIQMNIPATCCNVRFAYSYCCRNSAIKTGSAGEPFYTEAVVNRCLSSNPCNSSPIISNDPYAVVCGGQPYRYNNGVIDPDLDSLSYAFTPALIGQDSSVTYISPYWYDRPMPHRGTKDAVFPQGIRCDPQTGDIMFTSDHASDSPLVSVMAIEIKQWKKINGVPTVIGKTRRDIQMYLYKCPPNNPPYFATRPSNSEDQPRQFWSICAGQQLCFDIVAKDRDFDPPSRSDTTALTWNQALAKYGATFTRNYNPAQRKQSGPREDDWKFCWTPHDTLGRSTPYYFTATVKDDRCPRQGQTTQAFSIRVLASPDVILHKTDYGCGKWKVSYSLPAEKSNQKLWLHTWQISKEPDDYGFLNGAYVYYNVSETPAISFTKGGKYLVMLTAGFLDYPNSCAKTFYDTLVVDAPVKITAIEASICEGNIYSFNGKTLTQTGVYIDSLKTTTGCDSIVSLNLIVNTKTASQQNVSVCIGASYNFNGKIITQNGTYYDTIPNAAGCDSMITLTLTQKQILEEPVSVGICTGGSYNFNGKILIQAGTYYDTLQSTFGCDSVVILSLSINQPTASNPSVMICAGTSYNFNGTLLTQAGTYIDTIPSHAGCDSVITLQVGIKQPTASVQNVTACESYNFNGRIISQSGTYTDTIPNSVGCDSVITLNITLNSASLWLFTKTICQGELYDFNGKILTQHGWYYDTLQNVFGCDSVLVLYLTVNSVNTGVMRDSHILVALEDGAGTTYRWLDCNNNFAPVSGATSSGFTPAQSGDYAVAVMLNGCIDTSICYNVTFTALNELQVLQNQVYVYPNPAKDVVTISNIPQGANIRITDVTGKVVMKLTSNETEITASISEFANGIYFVHLEHEGSTANKKFVVSK